MRPRWRTLAIALFTVCFLVGGLFGNRVLALTDEARELLRQYTELVTLVHEQYGDEVAYRDLVHSSIGGVLRTLDPHSNFLSAESYSNMRDRQKSTFYGLGILVGMRNGQLTVITPIEGTPASRLGIRAGDVISTIEGESTETMHIDEAVRRLKGPKGTQVQIQIVRVGLDDPLDLAITRDEIPQDTVRYAYMIAPDIGYLNISDFNRGTGKEVADALAELKSQGMEQLLLDLRNNGGGLLDQAIEVADQFLTSGNDIVVTRGRTRDSDHEYQASDRHGELGMPVVVLVNDGTASAAEIVAGAIQDHDIGLIVGNPTWGKGLVQTVYTLSYGSGIALTTAKYYTPSGRLIQRDYSSWFDYANYSTGNGEVLDPTNQELDPEGFFLTDLGRKVYGGGGITPDLEVDLNTISSFLQFVLSRNSFFDFAVEYSSRNPVDSRDWQPPAGLVAEFGTWLLENDKVEAKELESAFEDEENLAVIQRYLHGEIFNSAFGIEARFEVLAQGDRQIQTALDLFGDASDLLARRRNLDRQVAETSTAARPGG